MGTCKLCVLTITYSFGVDIDICCLHDQWLFIEGKQMSSSNVGDEVL